MAIVSDIEIRLRADIARLQTDMTAARSTVDTALNGMAQSAAKLKGIIGGALVGFVSASFIKDITLLNARFETMGIVMGVAGNNAGYTRAQMGALEQDLQKTGISAIKARENLTSLATANIDLSKASKLARAAQDLAVVGNTNSSDAFARMVDGIKSGEVEVLRHLGLNVSFEGSYKRLAQQLGTTTEKLTEQQKIQARANEVIKQSAAYAGIYEESLGAAGKQLQSLTRYIEDAKVKLGETFNESLGFAVGKFTEAMKAANAELDKAGGRGDTADIGHMLAVGFQEAYKAVAVLGANVSFVLTTLGREVGGFGAILGQIFVAPLRAVNNLGSALDAALSGDFKGAAAKADAALTDLKNGMSNVIDIWKDLDKQGEASRAALDAFEASTMGATAATKVQTQAEKDAADAKEKMRMAAGEAARTAAAAEAKALAAAEEARKQQKKYDEAYKTHIKDIYERTAAIELDMVTEGKLTEGQKYAIKILEDLRTGEIKLSDAKKKKLATDLEAMLVAERIRNAQDADAKARKEAEDATKAETDAAWDQVRALQEQIKTYGLTEEAILKLKATELSRQLQNGDLSELEQQRISMLLAATEEQIKLQKTLGKMKADTQFWTGMEDAAHTMFMSIENGNSNMWQRMKDSAKNMFFEWLYQMTVKKWVIQIGTAISGTAGVSGIANAAAASATSGGASALTSVAGIYNAAKMAYAAIGEGFAGIGTAVADGVQSILYATGQSTSILSNGAAATAAGVAAQYIAGLGAGKLAGSFISGGYGIGDHGSAVVNISAIAGAIFGGPIGGAIGGAIGGLLNRAFGMGSKNVNNTSLSGTLSPAGANVNTMQAWTQSGGWFRSDKSGTDSTALSATQNAAFASTYKAILDVSKVLGDTIGADTTALSGRVQQLKIDLTGITTEADQMAAITKFFAGVGDTIASELVPNLASFQTEGEALSATLQRVVGDYAMLDTALASIGTTFGAVGVASIAARENLIKAAGGMDALTKGLSYFQQNFLTEAEQLAPVQKQVAEALAAMGFAGVKTNEQFKAAALGIDLTTQAGADLFAKMLALAPAFKAVTDATDAAAKAAADLTAQQAASAAQAAQAAAAAKAQALADNETLLRGQVSSALDQLKTAVDARKESLKSSFDDLMASLSASIDSWGVKITNLKSLSSLLAGAKVGATQSAVNRESAQAQIEAALAIAKSSGVLPSADSIKDAISTVTADSSNQFSTLIEYQRDQARASRSIAGLAGLTDDQLTTAEKTLQVLQNQKASADYAYARQISALDAIVAAGEKAAGIALGTYQATLSVDAGIATLAAAVAALKLGATTSNPTGTGMTVADLYTTVLGRTADATGLAYWQKVFGESVDASEYAQFITGAAPELAAKASGTWAQWLAEHGAGGTAPAGKGSDMQTALDTFNAQVSGMQAALDRTAKSTQQLADQFNQVSAGGNALLTESA